MTKGEAEAYSTLKMSLMSLLIDVEAYCRDYDCGKELLTKCKTTRENLEKANKLFNKGKRK